MTLNDRWGELTASVAAQAAVPAEILDGHLVALSAAVGDERGLSHGELAFARNRGGRAAIAGLSLSAAIDAHVTAAARWWALEPQAGHAQAATLLSAINDTLGALADGYQRARRAAVREQVAARREFADDLLSGRGTAADMLDRAAAFGVSLRRPRAVAVIATERPLRESTAAFAHLQRALGGHDDDLEAFVITKADRVVIVFGDRDRDQDGPGQTEDAAQRLITRVRRALGRGEDGVSLLRRVDLGRWQLALGRPGTGAAGVRTSYDEASGVLGLAARLQLRDRVLRASDLLVYQVLLRDRAAMIDLIATVLTPLLDARGGAEPLLATLRAYFAAGTNTALAARELHLSVRAVQYRLDRVRHLTGYHPDHPDQRFTLQTAVLGARLVDWPATPLVD